MHVRRIDGHFSMTAKLWKQPLIVSTGPVEFTAENRRQLEDPRPQRELQRSLLGQDGPGHGAEAYQRRVCLNAVGVRVAGEADAASPGHPRRTQQ